MTERVLGPSGSTRRRRFLFWPLLMAACTALFLVAGAQAVHDTGSFELDGNAATATSHDWDQVCFQAVADARCGTTTGAAAKAASWTSDGLKGETDPFVNNPAATIFTGGGSKDPIDISSWAWKDGAGGLPDKDNLVHSFAARYSLPPTNGGDPPGATNCPNGTGGTGQPAFDPTIKCEVLFFGSDRFDNSGDAQQGFWFFQNPIGLGSTPNGGGFNFTGVHRNGDLLIISNFSNGGTTSTISVYKWNSAVNGNLELLATSNAANCNTAGPRPAFCGLVNPATITQPWPFLDKSGTTLNRALNGEFYEGGVNLSTLGLGGECFASVASETRSSTSTTAVLKDFVLGSFGKCDTTLATTPKQNDGTTSIPAAGLPIGAGADVSVKDSAQLTVDGVSTWSGNLKFFLCKVATLTDTCTAGGTQIGAAAGITVTQATGNPILSDTAHVTSAANGTTGAPGRYCWRAEFKSATNGVPDKTDSSANECFIITPLQPTIPTQASAAVSLGSPVSDTANLAGTANKPGTPVINPTTAGLGAGGSITFKLYGPNDPNCGAANLVFTSAAIPVTGDGAYASGNFTPTAVGTYRWVASYTGDAPNTLLANGVCGAANESVIVSNSGLVTTPKDAAGANIPAGGLSIGTGSVSVKDSAALTITGESTWTGTLKFFLCKVATISDTATGCTNQIGSDITVTNATTQPIVSDLASVTAAANGSAGAPGRYCWRSTFTSGTSGVPNSSDASAGECFIVNPKLPTLTTNATPAVEIGSALDDTAHLGGTANKPGSPVINPTTAGLAAGGTITFTLYSPAGANNCGTAIATRVVNVSGNGDYKASDGSGIGLLTPGAGTYYWIASYSGDDPNTLGKSGLCGDDNESSRVVDAKISITPSQTNEVKVPHTFTVNIKATDASGTFQNVAGLHPTVTLTPSNGASDPVLGVTDTCASTGTDASGNCTVTFHSDKAGQVTGHATITFSVAGVSLTRATGDSHAGDSADAVKTYVDAQIDLSPLTATNEINHAHTITATVQQDDGRTAAQGGDGVTGFTSAPNGTLVTFSLLNNTANAGFVGGSTCTTTGGTCSVQINTSTAGSVDIHATTTFSVDTVSLTRATGTGGDNSADANKVYVDANINVSPLEKTNIVGDSHTLTVTVQQNDGLPAGAPGDAVTGYGPPPVATPVTVTLTNDATSTYQIISNSCATLGTDANGNCTIVFTSPTPGTVTEHASVTFLVGGVSLTRATGDSHVGDGPDAVKHFIELQPTMDTAQRFVPNDSATVTAASGAGNLAGSVRFRLYDNDTCTPSGTTLYDKTFNLVTDGTGTGLSRTVSTDNATAYTVDKSFSWLVQYTSTNIGHRNVTSECHHEHSSITIVNGSTSNTP